ncbi:MAG: glycoside hydrolase family 16 protein [Terracidiphilus sp.]|jgi:beta-glucanase (GH16 family)
MIRLNSRLRGILSVLLSLSLFAAANAYGRGAKHEDKGKTENKNWTLVWSDEFNGPDGAMPDPGKWTAVRNGSGYGNRELEYYTDRTSNLHLEKGNLVITARKENYTGADGVQKEYTSARLETAGHFEEKYGRVEARIKIPKGQGVWPAFWMLGTDYASTGWPDCGEIDIMENVGSEPAKVHGSLHGHGYSGSNPLSGVFTLPDGAQFSDDFHVFAIEWEPGAIRFYVDNTLYETQTSHSLPPNARWSFDHPFYVVLNLAIGGYWPGDPDATTSFPVNMLVDYVRVYKPKDDPSEKAQR